MAYKDFGDFSINNHEGTSSSQITLQADGSALDLPDASFIRDADMTRDGMDLILDGPDGVVVIESYFAAEPTPVLNAPDGSTLTPELVDSFARSPAQFAQNGSLSDVSPVGAVDELSGDATITRMDGTVDTLEIGAPIFQGDIIETGENGAVNIVFSDETSFAVSEDARLTIDEYVFDPSTNEGSQNFSVLKGVFVFTSGLIGREDPDDVEIDTPIGSIGIRGTKIAGDLDTGEITVIEGAIVLRGLDGQELTLANQFETGRFAANGQGVTHMGQLSAQDVGTRFEGVSSVAPAFFTPINDAAAENQNGKPIPAEQMPEGQDPQDMSDDAPIEGMLKGTVEGDPNAVQEGTVEAAALGDNPSPEAKHGEAEPAMEGEQDPLHMEDAREILDSPLTGMGEFGVREFGMGNGKFESMMMDGARLDGLHDPILAFGTKEPLPEDTAHKIFDHITTTTIDWISNESEPTNLAPKHFDQAPPIFFAGIENGSWAYQFNKDFHDFDGPDDAIRYRLSGSTIDQLNAWTNDGPGGTNPDILASTGTGIIGLAGDGGHGWTFNPLNGELTLDFFGEFSNGTQNMTIQVAARDSDGAWSSFNDYNFTAYNPDITINNFAGNETGKIIEYTGPGASLDAGVNNNTVFFGSGNNTAGISGNNNILYMGDGTMGEESNTATLFDTANGNTVIGGFNRDEFAIKNQDNTLYGMDGDDDFTLMLDYLGDVASLDIHGNQSSYRVFDKLNDLGQTQYKPLGESNGRGDSLILSSISEKSLDFTQLGSNDLSGIERIATAGTGDQTITLNYQNIIDMTDWKNTLTINLDNSDTLNLAGFKFDNFTKILNDESINDGYQATYDIKTYDVWSDGTVTLLISDAGSAAVTVNAVASGDTW